MAHQEGLALKMVAGSSADGTKALRQALHESAEEIYTTIEKLMLQVLRHSLCPVQKLDDLFYIGPKVRFVNYMSG